MMPADRSGPEAAPAPVLPSAICMPALDHLLRRLTATARPQDVSPVVSGRPSLVVACLAAAWCALVNLTCALVGTGFAPGLLLASSPAFLGLLVALQLNARGRTRSAVWAFAAASATALLALPLFGFGGATHFHFGFLTIPLAVTLLMPTTAWLQTALLGLCGAAGFATFELAPDAAGAMAAVGQSAYPDASTVRWLAVLVPLNLAISFGWATWLAGRIAGSALDRLGDLALIHPGSGLPNGRAFDDAFGQFIARVRRNHQPAALMLVVIDGIDDIRLQHGRAVLDQLSRHVATQLRGRLRHHDVVAQLDTATFAVLLEARPDVAVDVAEAVRRQVQDNPLAITTERRLASTVCIGLIAVHAGMTQATARQQADDALSRARRGGRNRVEIHLGASAVSPGLRRVFSGGPSDPALTPPP